MSNYIKYVIMYIDVDEKIVKNDYFFAKMLSNFNKNMQNPKKHQKAIIDILLGNIHKFTYTNLEIMNEKPAV